MAIEVRWGSATHVGCVRRSNQDAVLAGPVVFAVADGMGGHAAGEVASALAVRALEGIERTPCLDEVVDAVRRANADILQDAEPGSGREGMGTTVTGLVLGCQHGQDVVMIFNVGDSRTYRAKGSDLTQVTVDHSLVAEMVRDGEITADDAFSHPSRNVVTRGLGMEGPLEVDLWTDDPATGTTYLMCSDGLTDELRDDVLRGVLASDGSPQEKADALVALALEAGAHDNVSVVVATIEGSADLDGAAEDTNPRGIAPIGAADEDTNPREGDG